MDKHQRKREAKRARRKVDSRRRRKSGKTWRTKGTGGPAFKIWRNNPIYEGRYLLDAHNFGIGG